MEACSALQIFHEGYKASYLKLTLLRVPVSKGTEIESLQKLLVTGLWSWFPLRQVPVEVALLHKGFCNVSATESHLITAVSGETISVYDLT